MTRLFVVLAKGGTPLLIQTEGEQRDSRFRGNDEFYA